MGAANPLYVRFLTRMSFRRKRAMVEKILRRTMRRPMPPTFSNGGRLNWRSCGLTASLRPMPGSGVPVPVAALPGRRNGV